MLNLRLLGSAFILCFSLSSLASSRNAEVHGLIDTLDSLNASEPSVRVHTIVAEGFEPPNDEEGQPSQTVG